MFEKVGEFFRQSAAMMTFLSIFGAGLVFSMFSLLFGGDHDHDVGHDHGGDHDDGDHGGPNIFSIRGLSLLATGFGGVGLLVMYATKHVLVASIAGLGFGWVFAVVGLSMMRVFMRQQSTSMISTEDYIGVVGVVTTSIPIKGLGEVRATVDGVTMTKAASAVGGKSLSTGTVVRVVRLLGGTLSVEEISEEQSAG